jgi:hypothetical protein
VILASQGAPSSVATRVQATGAPRGSCFDFLTYTEKSREKSEKGLFGMIGKIRKIIRQIVDS